MDGALGERRGKAPWPPLRRVRGDGRVRDGSRMAEAPLYRRLGAEPDSPAPKGGRLSRHPEPCGDPAARVQRPGELPRRRMEAGPVKDTPEGKFLYRSKVPDMFRPSYLACESDFSKVHYGETTRNHAKADSA